jgi:hypothetical protein
MSAHLAAQRLVLVPQPVDLLAHLLVRGVHELERFEGDHRHRRLARDHAAAPALVQKRRNCHTRRGDGLKDGVGLAVGRERARDGTLGALVDARVDLREPSGPVIRLPLPALRGLLTRDIEGPLVFQADQRLVLAFDALVDFGERPLAQARHRVVEFASSSMLLAPAGSGPTRRLRVSPRDLTGLNFAHQATHGPHGKLN